MVKIKVRFIYIFIRVWVRCLGLWLEWYSEWRGTGRNISVTFLVLSIEIIGLELGLN